MNKEQIKTLLESNDDITNHLIEQLTDCMPSLIGSKAITLTKEQIKANNSKILSLID